MLSAWYTAGSLYLTRKTPDGDTKNEAKAQRRTALLKAIDYSLVVASFIAGVILMALVTRWFGVFSIWLAALIAGAAFCFGYQAEKKEVRENQGA